VCTPSLIKGKTVTQGYPEDRIAHPKGEGLTQGYPEDHSPKEGGALNPRKFPWVTSQLKGRIPDHRSTAPGRTISGDLRQGPLL